MHACFSSFLGSSDHSARLWDLTTGETIRHYNGHKKAVVAVALHDVSVSF